MTTQSAARDDRVRRRSIGFLNWAHFLDHYVILIFPTVVIGLEAVYGRSYGDLLMLAIALFGVGLFAAIYHPVGTPMVVDAAVQRGRTMAFNGICGNIGVSIASGCTAVIAAWF